jgi:hypothetical protein
MVKHIKAGKVMDSSQSDFSVNKAGLQILYLGEIL